MTIKMDCISLTAFIKKVFDSRGLIEKPEGDFESAQALVEEINAISTECPGYIFTEKLKLEAQYNSQVQILKEANILETLSGGQEGILDIHGKECPVPSYQEIKARLTPEKIKILQEKREQGFTKLLLVPIGASIGYREQDTQTGRWNYFGLLGKFAELLRKLNQEGKFRATDGTPLDLNAEEPLWFWGDIKDAGKTGTLKYFSSTFDQNNHDGLTKDQVLETIGPWQILLVEDMPDLPAEGEGQASLDQRGIKSDRIPLEVNRTPIEYLAQLQTISQYAHEKGMTIESWFIYAITYLLEGKGMIDDWQGRGKACWLLGNFLPGSGMVPQAYLDLDVGHLGGGGSGSRDSVVGFRSSVEI